MHPSAKPAAGLLVFRDQLPLSNPYAAPRTETERSLAEIWRTVLSMDVVGIDDDYFDLGGDSLMAAVLFGMIETSLGFSIPLGTLVEASTVRRLAEVIDASECSVPTGGQNG
jgi:acyl carrier protein